MKKIIMVIVALVVIVILFLVYKNDRFNNEVMENTDFEVSGEVLSINTDQVAFDGPALLVLDRGEGQAPISIAVPSMGINLCPAKNTIADVYEIEVGDTVGALGSLDEYGFVVPCSLETHYLRVI